MVAVACGLMFATLRADGDSSAQLMAPSNWMAVVRSHVAGASDSAVDVARTWSAVDLAHIVNEAIFRSQSTLGRRKDVSHFQDGKTRELIHFLEQVMILNTDAALLPGGTQPRAHNDVVASRVLGPPPPVLDERDGVSVDARFASAHWGCARQIAWLIAVDDDGRRMVLAWLQTSIAALERTRHWGEALPQLRPALDRFGADLQILIEAAGLHEAFAGNRVRAGIAGAPALPAGVSLDIETPDNELRLAETYYRRAIATGSAPVWVHLHLGQVLLALDRLVEARTELTQSRAAVSDPDDRYFAAILLGALARREGDDKGAAAAFRQAAQLRPSAQAPWLGIADAAAHAGDLAAAADAVATATDPSRQIHDPWRDYDIAFVRNADELLRDFRAHQWQ